jgi:hypothetical protein
MPSLMVDFTISPDGFAAADDRPASGVSRALSTSRGAH